MKDPVKTDEYHHGRAVDAEEAKEIFMEKLREDVKADPAERARLALIYIEDHEEEFYGWAAQRLLDELTPVFGKGWDERPTNKEYWNFNDDRV